MACAGTYIGECCGEPPTSKIIRASRRLYGFVALDWSNHFDMYSYFESFVEWDFLDPFNQQPVSGSYSILGFFDEGATAPRYVFTGSPPPNLNKGSGAGTLAWNYVTVPTSVGPNLVTGTIQGNYPEGSFPLNVPIQVGSFRYIVEGASRASVLALQSALSYNPQTGDHDGHVVITGLGQSGLASLDHGNIAGNRFEYPRKTLQSTYQMYSTGDVDSTEGIAMRLIFAPDAQSRLRMRTYHRLEFDTSPISIQSCDSIELLNGADISVSQIPDPNQASFVECVKFPMNNLNPCLG